MAYPPKNQSISQFIYQVCNRYGIITKEIKALEQSQYSWQEVYEVLKQMEYSGKVLRGYFFKDISGIQFMLPEAAKNLNSYNQQYVVLNACDPAQPYGSIIAQSTINFSFTCIPGTILVLFNGSPVLIVERHGAKITFNESSKLFEAVTAFKKAFHEKNMA